jgi:predicted GTPase
MSENVLIAGLAERLKALRDEAIAIGSSPARLLTVRLDQALLRLETTAPNRPLQIALLGGTGVGKSKLFNALIDQPALSEKS